MKEAGQKTANEFGKSKNIFFLSNNDKSTIDNSTYEAENFI